MSTEKEQEVEQIEEQVSEQAAEATVESEQTPEAEAVTPTEAPESSEEAQIAAEALADIEDTEAQPGKETAPVSVVAGLRAKLRTEREANQRLSEAIQAQLVERSKPAEQPPELSPIEQYYKDNPELDPNMDAPPGGVILSDRKWQEQQAKKQRAEQQAQERKELGLESTARAQATFTDFDDVVAIGSRHLTDGNKLDIYKSKDPAATLYRLCVKATLESGTSDAAVMRQMMQAKQAKPKSGSTPKPKEKTTKEKTEPEPETPVEPVMSKELAQIYATFGFTT